MELTAEQSLILAKTDGSMRILAAAGSGKTTTMAAYVKQEINAARAQPEEICFITFTRFAAQQIKNRVKKVCGREVKILCGTFHSMMYQLLNAAGIRASKPDGLYDVRMEEWVRNFMIQMSERNPKLIAVLKRYKLLIVDEFQDLDEIQFEFVSQFKQIQPTLRILAVGDLAQNIYRFRGTSNEFLRTRLEREVCMDLSTYRLTTNFRSTKSILNFVNSVFQQEIVDNHILPMQPKPDAEEGMKPHYFEYAVNPGKGLGEYEELVAKTLLPILMRAKAESKSAVLIFPITKTGSFQLITSLLRQYSKERRFAFDLHQIAKEDETCATVAFRYEPKHSDSPIQFSTFHSSKGLEWDIVALIDVSDYMNCIRGDEEDCEAYYAEKTNLFYVGVTRAEKELYIFANANGGGRHRHLARLGDSITDVMDVTHWGEECKEWDEQKRKPISVTDLVRRLPQHIDLFERIRKCSEHIRSVGVDGFPMQCLDVYNEMKMRNRELAFGTYVDWKLKKMVCEGGAQTLQDVILELISCYSNGKYFYKSEATEELSLRLAKLDVYFMNADRTPSAPLEQYVIASRCLGLYNGRYYGLVDTFKDIYNRVQKRILAAAKKEKADVKDEYILSQLRNFYMRGGITEIEAVDAPNDMYMGLPDGFEEFVVENMEQAAMTIRGCLRDTGATGGLRGDVGLESASLIMGEADMVSANGVLLEIKCGTSTKAVEMRDTGGCKYLLQLLSYVALARHGTIPLELHRACIVNPLTGAWERYDLDTWSLEQSAEFMECLEELRARG
jgi:hypothetical protein